MNQIPDPVIVTGANGFIGARVVQRLLEQGRRVHALGRGRAGDPWPVRMRAALDDIAGAATDSALLSHLSCHAVDGADPGSLAGDSPDLLTLRHALLIHIAGDTKFNPGDPAAQRRLNVDATLAIVRALRPALARVVHTSTAYVCGDRAGTILETDLDCGQAFRNPYEKSKFEAEGAVTALCAELSLPLIIVRPSIIVNDTRTGRSSTFTHLNALVEVINRIQEYFGISDGEVVSRVIRLAADPAGRPNLAPVDPMVEAMIRLALDPRAAGRTFHLCHPAPQTNTEIIGLIAEAIGIRGKVALEYVRGLEEPASRTEKMIFRSLKVYAPYLNERAQFDLTETRRLLPDYDALFAPLDLPYLHRVIKFQRDSRARTM